MNIIFTNNDKKLFWILHASGWVLFLLQDMFIMTPIQELTAENIIERAVIISFGFLLTCLLRYFYKSKNFLSYSFASLTGIIIFSSLFCALLWHLSCMLYFTIMAAKDIQAFFKIAIRNISVIIRQNVVITAWSGLYFGIKFWMQWVEQKARTEQALLLARNAQLEMLRYQINPHFLFNTLSSLRALISSEPPKAEAMVSKISEFLRYSLTDAENDEVPLSKEIDILKSYIEIEKVRFGEKLQAEFNIAQLAEDYPIPVFLIHPLVENSVKHGMKTSREKLVLKVTADVKDDILFISVFNSGRWNDDEGNGRKGRGLENVKRRLQIASPLINSFDIIKEDNSVTVKISLKKELKDVNDGSKL